MGSLSNGSAAGTNKDYKTSGLLRSETVAQFHREYVDNGFVHRIAKERREIAIDLVRQVTASSINKKKV